MIGGRRMVSEEFRERLDAMLEKNGTKDSRRDSRGRGTL
jgi:hypothetical protein